MSACVYVARNSDGDVLYVGSTGNLKARIAAHSREKKWWGQVADLETIPAENRAAAFDLEREAIQVLAPRYNRRGLAAPKRLTRNIGRPCVVMRLSAWASLIDALDGPERLLADRLGVRYATFSDYKRGVANPSSKFIAAAIEATGLTFDELFEVVPSTVPVDQWRSRRGANKGAAA